VTRPARATAAALALLLVVQVVAVVSHGESSPLVVDRAAAEAALPPHPLVGAHYHLWYPENFGQGFLRGRLVPPQSPALGRYRSDDPAVAEQHIAWAAASGIDFFTLDWWPTRPAQNQRAFDGFLAADNIEDIRFCIFYETWDLGFDPPQEATPMRSPSVERFLADLADIADRVFDHPSYLRVGGRPVVVLYLSRTMTGDVAGAIGRARELLRRRGFDVFFIGDEVFWRTPEPERMRQFDAVTAYNLYEHEKPEHHGFAAETPMLADQMALYQEHAAAVAGAVPIVPSVFPGYNDRGVRLERQHAVVPRRFGPEDAEGTLLREMLRQVARPVLDRRLPMVLVTSWNEWNEDTAIEPLAPAPETALDSSPSRRDFTDGNAYGGGATQLEALRNEVVAVAGRVTDDDGEPEVGVRVEARRADQLVAADITDSTGRYTLSRFLLEPGPVVVTAAGVEGVVDVPADRTALVDLAA